MDNNQGQTTSSTVGSAPATSATQTTTPTPNTVSGLDVNSELLLTQQIDPFSISKDQMEKDLELLKNSDTKKDDGKDFIVQEDGKPKFVPFMKMKINEIDVLRLKNPFKGQ